MDQPTPDPPSIQHPSVGEPRYWQIAWLLVFLGNLPVPLFLATEVVKNGGYWGVIASLVLLWLAGHLACRRSNLFAKRIVIGGAIVGASQLWPLPQLMAGLFGLAAAGFDPGDIPINTATPSEWQGFVATFVTGGLLMAAAATIGMLVVAIGAAAKGPQQ
ncbi:MAG: hypothetical protein SH850_19525 [Planctomycetaceae bacterium]|nr:hypothetical protein [Planctomycetaceae bacterium]